MGAVRAHSELCSFQRKWHANRHVPGANHIAVNHGHNLLWAVVISSSAAEVEAESVIFGLKAFHRLPNERAKALQDGCLIEGQSVKGRRIDCTVRTGDAGATKAGRAG